MAIDFNKPVTTDLYTAWPTEIQANQQALGMWLDSALVTYANQPTGTKRWNSVSGLIEGWSGSAWTATPTGYVVTTGSIFSGAMTFNNSVALQWKDGGGTARRIGLVNGAGDMFYGDIDTAVAGGGLYLYGNASVNLRVGGTTVASVDASGVNSAGTFTAKAPESYRMINSGGYISGWNGANTTRTGYLQFNAGANVLLYAENGASLSLGTAGANRVNIDTSGNVGVNVAPVAIAKLYVNGGFYLQGAATLPAGTGVGLFSVEATVLREYIGDGTGYSRAWAKRAASVTTDLMTLNDGGALTLTGTMQIQPPNVSGVQAGLNLYDAGGGAGEGAYIQWESSSRNGMGRLYTAGNSTAGGDMYFQVNSANTGTPTTRLEIFAPGNSVFTGAVATTPVASVNSGTAIALDCRQSNVFPITMTGNVAAGSTAFNNPSDGQTINVFLTQDGTGTRTLALTSANGFKWPGGTAGVLSTAAGSVDLLVATYRAATGFWYCTLAKGFA